MPRGAKAEIGLQQALELEQRLVVERRRTGGPSARCRPREGSSDRLPREAGVVLLAREALLLRGRDDLAVAHQSAAALSW